MICALKHGWNFKRNENGDISLRGSTLLRPLKAECRYHLESIQLQITEISNYRGLNNKVIELVYIKKSSEAASSTVQWISRLLPSFRFVPFSVLAFVFRHIALWLQDSFLSSCHHIFLLPPLSAGGEGVGEVANVYSVFLSCLSLYTRRIIFPSLHLCLNVQKKSHYNRPMGNGNGKWNSMTDLDQDSPCKAELSKSIFFSMMMAMSRSVLSDMVSISHMWLLVLELFIASETKELNFY